MQKMSFVSERTSQSSVLHAKSAPYYACMSRTLRLLIAVWYATIDTVAAIRQAKQQQIFINASVFN